MADIYYRFISADISAGHTASKIRRFMPRRCRCVMLSCHVYCRCRRAATPLAAFIFCRPFLPRFLELRRSGARCFRRASSAATRRTLISYETSEYHRYILLISDCISRFMFLYCFIDRRLPDDDINIYNGIRSFGISLLLSVYRI